MGRVLFTLMLTFCLLAVLPPAGGAEGPHAGHNAGPAAEPAHMDSSRMADMAGHSAESHREMMNEAKNRGEELAAKVRVEEHLGGYIDFTARFVDARNRPVDLKTIFDKPVIILPVYFMCPTVCNLLQAELAKVLNLTKEIPGRDFNVISLGFSDDEDASHALSSKQNYANLVKREINLENWYYLTSDRENILRLTDSLGFYFVKQETNVYIHPNVMVVLARDGKIIRYLYGPRFLPFDVGMALTEARKGEPGISIKRGVLSFCFGYDPENRTYVFRVFRITGTTVLVLLAVFVFFLLRPSRSGKKRGLSSEKQPPDQ